MKKMLFLLFQTMSLIVALTLGGATYAKSDDSPLCALIADTNLEDLMEGREVIGPDYTLMGGSYVWQGSSPSKCHIEHVKDGMTPQEQLIFLMRMHSKAKRIIGGAGQSVRSYCKLFADDDVEFDVRGEIGAGNIFSQPREIIYVSRIDGGSLFSMECIAGRVGGFMPAKPADL